MRHVLAPTTFTYVYRITEQVILNFFRYLHSQNRRLDDDFVGDDKVLLTNFNARKSVLPSKLDKSLATRLRSSQN